MLGKRYLIGVRFGKLVVESYLHHRSDRSYWECRCDCGRTEISTNHALKRMGKDACKACRYTTPDVPLFSNEDSDLLGHQWKTDRLGYARKRWTPSMGIVRTCHSIRAHRVVMTRVLGRDLLRSELVDHINRNKMDNRRENLRLATPSENCQNRRISAKSKSGVRGVSWCKRLNKWKAGGRFCRLQYHVGYFNDLREAEAAINAKRAELGYLPDIDRRNAICPS